MTHCCGGLRTFVQKYPTFRKPATPPRPPPSRSGFSSTSRSPRPASNANLPNKPWPKPPASTTCGACLALTDLAKLRELEAERAAVRERLNFHRSKAD